jgi:hypothetical protein
MASKLIKKLAIGAFAMVAGTAVSGCSDATKAAWGNLGEEAKIKVYSGGKLIYEGVTTGKIENESGSDGYYFNDKCVPGSNKLVEVSGDVIISRNDLNCPKVREPAYTLAP